MKTKLDITLTDFIYAIVVGAAFQRIDAPIFVYQNFLLLLAFIVIIDDWVLYHVQAAKVSDSNRSFAWSLIIDSTVLLLWYCAAVSGAHVYQLDFYAFLAAFYFATLVWEFVFKGATGNLGRIGPDACSIAILICGAIFHEAIWYPYLGIVLAGLWLAARAVAWRRIVFVA